MIANIKDVITLDDDNDYVVVSKIKYDNKYYYYLIDMNKRSNIKFCYEDGEYLVQFSDSKLIEKLLPQFLKVSKTEIENLQKD